MLGGRDVRPLWAAGVFAGMVAACGGAAEDASTETSAGDAPSVPVFQADTEWPALPDGSITASILGVFVDADDHVWVSHRAELIDAEDLAAVPGGVQAPLVMEFDPEGQLVQGWGPPEETDQWPAVLHGLFLDHTGHLWSNARDQHQIMKFTRSGERVLTIGVENETGGSDDPERLGRPAGLWVDPNANELYVADGYTNRRVVVFDAETGAYLRHWGANGLPPVDGGRGRGARAADEPQEGAEPPVRQFSTVHGITGSSDGLIYVADRQNSRVQVFRPDGEFVRERVLREGGGGAFDVAIDPSERFLYVADGTQHKIWILERATLETLGEFGSEGAGPGQFQRPHNLSVDSEGNLYVGEADPGWRVQKLTLTAAGAP